MEKSQNLQFFTLSWDCLARHPPHCSWLHSHFEPRPVVPSPEPSPSQCSSQGPSALAQWCDAAEAMKDVYQLPNNQTSRVNIQCYITFRQGKSLVSSMRRGRRTNLMKPIWDEGLVTLSLSMKGVTGRPSNFSTSLCSQKTRVKGNNLIIKMLTQSDHWSLW